MSGRSGTATCAQGATPSPMKRGRRLPYYFLLTAVLLGAAILKKDAGVGLPSAPPRSTAQWAQVYAALPMSFEANRGQTDPRVSFLSRGQGYALFLTGNSAVLSLNTPAAPAKGQKSPASAAALRLQLLGASANPVMTGNDELPGKANYFLGNDHSKWRTNVPTYAKVRYQNVYPGVDLVYYGTRGGKLEYDFIVARGADPHAIAMDVAADSVDGKKGAPLQINSAGDLVVALPAGNVEFHKPVVYQTKAHRQSSVGDRQLVDGHYALDAQNHVRFELGPYDHTQPLVIDPVLLYATYIGGTGGDIGYAIAVDTENSVFDAYITGVTNSIDFPIANAPGVVGYQTVNKGNGDAFVAKLNAAGTQIIYSTYLGGSGTDTATAIAVRAGSAFITGYTTSTDFPLAVPPTVGTVNSFQVNYGGNTDAFVSELGAGGDTLFYSSYLGGNGADFGQGIAVDSSGNAYVTGSTQSANFPVLNALQSVIGGSQDAFVTKVDVNGEHILYSTYLGGTQADVGQGIQLDSSNNIYLTGYTFSPDFPMASASLLQNTIGGGADAFVCELNAAGSALTFSTFLGGSGDDRAYGIALDSSQNIYITGATSSANFPTTSGVFQPSLRGPANAFVSKLNHAGSALIYSTYLGGTGVDQGNSIAVTSAGVAFVTGFTQSSDFPTQNPIQAVLGLSNNNLCGTNPCPDAFVTQLNAAGNALTYSTFLGGNGPDFGQGIAVDTTGDPYITGSTSSTNLPAIFGSYKTSLTGTAGNAFIAKIDAANETNIAILPSTLTFGNETLSVKSAFQTITIVNPSTAPLTITAIAVGLVGTDATVFTTDNGNCLGTIPGGGGYCTMNVAFTPDAIGPLTDQITLTDNALAVAGTQQIITLTGTGVTAATSVTVQPTALSFSSQSVGTLSPAQSVTVTNTGTQTLDISNIGIAPTGDFTQTNTCGAVQNTLSVGQSCTVSVTFSPTASGNRVADLQISDNAAGSPQAVLLTGIGAAAFTLSNPTGSSTQTVNPTVIGDTSTTFTITANAPTGSSFNGAITLTCSAGTTCAFSINPIFVGTSTTLTVSNLTTNLSNPYQIIVTGTSGSQSTTLQLNLGFEDFALTATPSSRVIQAGTATSYNINVNPLNGFNQQLTLSCIPASMPPDAVCSFSNSQPTPNGTSPTQVSLNITTVKYVPITALGLPRIPPGRLPPLIFGLLSLLGLASLALVNKRRGRHGWLGSGWMGVRLAILSLILTLNLAMAACRQSTLVISGTTIGNYVITIQGTLTSNTAVVRTTTLNLSVTATAP